MFFNIDFINNPTFADYDVTKGVVAHVLLLLNALMIPVLGYTKIKFERNMLHIVITILSMYIIGTYCNLLFETLVSYDYAYEISVMFKKVIKMIILSFLTSY